MLLLPCALSLQFRWLFTPMMQQGVGVVHRPRERRLVVPRENSP